MGPRAGLDVLEKTEISYLTGIRTPNRPTPSPYTDYIFQFLILCNGDSVHAHTLRCCYIF